MSKDPLMWHTEQRKLSQLIPYAYNPRKLSEKDRSDLTQSISKFDMVEIPAIDLDNTIIAGHQRTMIALLLFGKNRTIDVRVPNRKLTEEEFQQYNIRSNKNGAGWDIKILSKAFNKEALISFGFLDSELQWNAPLLRRSPNDQQGANAAPKNMQHKIKFQNEGQLKLWSRFMQHLLMTYGDLPINKRLSLAITEQMNKEQK